MSSKLPLVSLSAILAATPALADAPRVAVDIAPVHSLVARVMQGTGTPDLIVSPGASPHEYTLRPSQAASLQAADLVITVTPGLTPWLAEALVTLAENATVIELIETAGTTELANREGALFEGHAEDEHEDHDDEEHHDDHADDDHDEEGHDDHDEEHHAHGDHDPHAWLSPTNAAVWINVIAAELSALDPENADTYQANATAALTEIEALRAEIETTLAPVRGHNFIVFHDAYQYFETDFAFPASGAIALSDASQPGPARIAEIRDRIRAEGIDCVLAEPQFNPGLVASVLEGTEANTGVLDPLGSNLEPGPDLYPPAMCDQNRPASFQLPE